jgi:Glycosyl transferase family 11
MPKTNTITIKGGLGNQLFQYAYGRKLEIIDKKTVIFDTSFFTQNTKDIFRPFLLDKFNINPEAKFSPVKKNPILELVVKIFQKITGKYPYYQSEKYFAEIKNQILTEFTLKTPLSTQAENIYNNIKLQSNPVSLHIRRGDYVNNKHHPLCDLEYYYHAEHYIKSKINNPLFFIFSDDIEWVRQNLKISNCVFVSNPNITEVEELTLMSNCSHNIIANSTFSWWGAYLNQKDGKIVIAPKQWTKNKSSNELDILPKNWIQI